MESQLDEYSDPEKPVLGIKATRARIKSNREARRQGKHHPQPERAVPATPKDTNKGNSRPAGVSDRVWQLAKYWMDLGEATLNERPPVNLSKFSIKLSSVIAHDPQVVKILGTDRDAKRERYVNDMVHRMIELFWSDLAKEVPKTSLQFKFLYDEWNLLVYNARTSLAVSKLLKSGRTLPAPEWPGPDNAYTRWERQHRIDTYLKHIEALADQEQEPPSRTDSPESLRVTILNRLKGNHRNA